MKNILILRWLASGVGGFLFLSVPGNLLAGPDPEWYGHDRERPQPPVVNPGTPSSLEQPGQPPADAVVLFGGKDLSQWASMDGSPTRWIMKDGYMECVRGSGYIRTLQNFGDCQLHVEFCTPVPAEGEGQGRGNSGVFLGLDRYEIQVLDSYGNKTYADGSCGSIYGQYPPLVNVSRPPGQWQTYDIFYTAPRFDEQGKLLSPVRLTVCHNGVLIQNNVDLTGPTGWLGRAPYQPHPEKQPISLQDHGNPVRYRNIWARELGKIRKQEFTFSDALLSSYTGTYELGPNNTATVSRENGQLTLLFQGNKFVMFAESETKFFAKTTDVQCVFEVGADKKVIGATLSVGEGGMKAKKVK
jgi:hypothetical protein